MQEYDDQAYQDIYYIAESFEDAKSKFRCWISHNLSRHFTVRYLPFTQSIQVVDTVEAARDIIQVGVKRAGIIFIFLYFFAIASFWQLK